MYVYIKLILKSEETIMKFKDLLNLRDHYLYIQDIKECGQNTLELIIEFHYMFPKTRENVLFSQIYKDDQKPIVKITFDFYIAYSVLNESYVVKDSYEEYKGAFFRLYKKSRYLDYINLGTIATSDYPGPFKHYGICALDHIIDVVSVEEPIIEVIQNN